MLVRETNALLRGGPSAEFTEEQRVRHVPEGTSTLKLARGNRYEHFQPTGETVHHRGRDLRVFVWSGCTYLAE